MGKLIPETRQQGMTGIHRRLLVAVKLCGVAAEVEFQVGRFALDVYVPEWHLGFEADGPQHRRKHDEPRDAELLETWGLPVLRFKQRPLLGPTEPVVAAIRAFAEEHAGSREARYMRYLAALSG